jgi:hypothetical protein
LRACRGHAQRLRELSDQWQWQTDREHHLVVLQPPAASAAFQWLPGAGPSPSPPSLWDALVPEAEADLRARMDRHEALQDLAVSLPALHGGRTSQAARLRGRVRTDVRGAFAGYDGTLTVLEFAPDRQPATASTGRERPRILRLHHLA